MTDFTPHMAFPMPTGSCSGLSSRIRQAIIEVDAIPDLKSRDEGLVYALLAASRIMTDNGCFCSQCQDEYLWSVRILMSDQGGSKQ